MAGEISMLDTKIGQSRKDDPVDVAKAGYEAMMSGDGDVVTGFTNAIERPGRTTS
jgi:hypothetical protein